MISLRKTDRECERRTFSIVRVERTLKFRDGSGVIEQ